MGELTQMWTLSLGQMKHSYLSRGEKRKKREESKKYVGKLQKIRAFFSPPAECATSAAAPVPNESGPPTPRM